MSNTNYSLEYFDVIESTHQYALHLEQSKLPKVVISAQQTAGIGQFGRKWMSEPNSSLLMSVCCFSEPKADLHLIPFLLGKSVHQAIGNPEVLLKWPNDLYYSKRKLGGLLCESRFQGNQISKIVMSCGVNLQKQAHLSDEIAALSELDVQETNLELADRIVKFLLHNYTHDDNETIVAYYNQHLFGKDAYYCYENPMESLELRSVALSENGNLELKSKEGKTIIFDSPGTYKLAL